MTSPPATSRRPRATLPASKRLTMATPQDTSTAASQPASRQADAIMVAALALLPSGLKAMVLAPIGQARPLPKTTRSEYLAFCGAVIQERGAVCQGCGRTAGQAGQKALHLHHVWPISKSGIHHPLVMARCNVSVLCDWCHGLQHPCKRDYQWGKAGSGRGRALA